MRIEDDFGSFCIMGKKCIVIAMKSYIALLAFDCVTRVIIETKQVTAEQCPKGYLKEVFVNLSVTFRFHRKKVW